MRTQQKAILRYALFPTVSNNSYTINNLKANHTMTAVFAATVAQTQYTLTVTKTGTGAAGTKNEEL